MFADKNVDVDVLGGRTLVLLTLHSQQALLGFPQYTILACDGKLDDTGHTSTDRLLDGAPSVMITLERGML